MHLLRDNCIRCHNAKKTKGNLNLTKRTLALKGGGEGPALLPGQAAQSRIIRFLEPDSDPHMPPKKQLDEEQIAAGISPDMIRISVGLEDIEDILWDLDQALQASQSVVA